MKYYLKDNKLLKVGSLALTEKTNTYEGNGASEVKAGGDLVYYGNSHLSFGKTDLSLKPHIEGIKVDEGYVRSYKDIKSIYKMLDDNGLITNTQLLFIPEALKYRINGSNRFVSKGYDLSGNGNHLVQTTETRQSALNGNIAPSEKFSVRGYGSSGADVNYNGLIHNSISFLNSFCVTLVFNDFGVPSWGRYLVGGSNNTFVTTRLSNNDGIRYGANSFQNSSFVHKNVGKNTIVQIIYYGDGTAASFINGTDKVTISTSISSCYFNSFFYYYGRGMNGTISYYRLQSGAMTDAQALAEYNTLRAIYPEIPSVTIGTQTWATSNLEMVSTPRGNVIPNVTDNAAWANATTLYNDAIAGGATEADAVKAAAMWCYYNNDPNYGAVYGKLYNWYAAKLLQNDIDAYNVANPNNKWGWRLPTYNDFLTLQSYLTSNKVEGINTSKDLYVKGNSYDTSNGTNRYGFSFIGSTLRINNGDFMSVNHSRLHIYNAGSTDFRIWTKYNNDVDLATSYPQMGAHIRLIKDE